MDETHEDFMKQALRQAQQALDENEVPVGAVVVLKNRIIARGYNQVELLKDATAHAEMIALTAAFGYLGAKYLPEAVMYVTIEPCTMCCGALYWSKIGGVVYGAPDPKHGGISLHGNVLHPKTEILKGILEKDCASLMKSFFAARRN